MNLLARELAKKLADREAAIKRVRAVCEPISGNKCDLDIAQCALEKIRTIHRPDPTTSWCVQLPVGMAVPHLRLRRRWGMNTEQREEHHMTTCQTCGEQFTPRPQHGDRPRQRFCTFDCWKAHSRSHYDEMLTLIQLGETPRSAAERVGVSVVAAERWFRRHGHLNLARMFARARKSGAYA